MDAVDAVLNAVRAFLANDLSYHCLPPHVEERRQILLENLDLLPFGPCPSPPLPPPPLSIHSLMPPSASMSPQVPIQRQCHFRSKRHSMPPAVAFPPYARLPNLLDDDVAAINITSSSATSVYATPCGPSQRVSMETATQAPGASATSPLYEEPASFIQRLSLQHQKEEESSPPCCRDQHHQSQPFSSLRSSLLESSTSSISLSHQNVPLDERSPSSSLPTCQVSTENTFDTTDLGTLILPKKSSISSRRFPSSCTLVGALYHRYKPRKWSRLGYCLLTPDAHLLGFRSQHSALTSPAVSLFVAAASIVAVYAGPESGMQHVFKITHAASVSPGTGSGGMVAATASVHGGGGEGRALVFAADCEAEALTWISQINQYAKGITPSQMKSFTDHDCCQRRRRSSEMTDVLSLADFPRTPSVVSVAPRRKGIIGKRTRPHSLFLPPVNTSPSFLNGVEVTQQQPSQPLPLPSSASDANQEDSGFSGLISSSSSATDGTNGELTDQRTSSHITTDAVDSPPHHHHALATTTTSSCDIQSRASGLFSSVRRKVVDSFNLPKRRSLVLSSRTLHSLELAQSSSSPTTRCGWSELEVIANDASMALPRTRAWRSVRGLMGRKAIQRPHVKLSSGVDDSLLAGDVFISVPGRLSWTLRWCVLHDSVLEIYASASTLELDIHDSPSPFLILPLRPGVVEVAPAFDKRHPLAVRLSAPSLTPLPLLLDAGDTVVMGRWIRAIIAALGHITQSISAINPASATVDCNSSEPTTTVASRRLSEILPPPSPEPIYDEVAANTVASKRWTWTAPPPVTWRSVVMEVTPLPTLPSSGPSSPTDSSLNGGGIYSSVYYDSAITVEEEENDAANDNSISIALRPAQSFNYKTSQEQLFRSYSSLQVPSTFSTSNMTEENSCLFHLMKNRCDTGGVFSSHRYRSLDWSFSVRSEAGSTPTGLPFLSCSADDKIASFFHLSPVTTPITLSAATVVVARSYSSAASTTVNQGNAEEIIPSPRGATMPLGRITSLHDPPSIEEHRQQGFVAGDDLKEALDALDAATGALYLSECVALLPVADSGAQLHNAPSASVVQPKKQRRHRRRN